MPGLVSASHSLLPQEACVYAVVLIAIEYRGSLSSLQEETVAKAIYEKGVLRPLQDLGLQEGEEVEIIVRRRPSLRQEDVDRVIEEIDDEGIL
ncbi:hypothetical protein Pyrde_0849 [Pyrodictium delaneyi]|uniref:Antitoxin n=1 Tax=Pyrodictium delaneyi TaxID=1273541 RepID=A0A0P0N2P2_9CREN|nr:hypothetical protein Pyrde_0849 [Pyrodictium delaneyi]